MSKRCKVCNEKRIHASTCKYAQHAHGAYGVGVYSGETYDDGHSSSSCTII